MRGTINCALWRLYIYIIYIIYIFEVNIGHPYEDVHHWYRSLGIGKKCGLDLWDYWNMKADCIRRPPGNHG